VPTMQNADADLSNQQLPRTPTKRATRATWLATLASAAACALPLLFTGGLAAGVGALINGWIVVAVIAAAGVGGAGLWWRRRRREPSC
jgi:hypothetical protein